MKKITFLLTLVLAFLVIAHASQAKTEKIYYASEVNGVVCGYSEAELSPMEKDGRELLLLKQNAFVMLSALGAEWNSEVTLTYHIDPSSGNYVYHDSDVKQGPTELWSKLYIEGNKAHFTSNLSEDETVVELTPETVLDNTVVFPHLISDFVESGLEEKTYDILEVREWEVQKTTFKKVGIETIRLAGEKYQALVVDAMKLATALKYRQWIDVETGYILKTELPNNRAIYRAKASIKKRIETANLDTSILSKAGVLIADYQAISYMKVQAKIEPYGLRVTPESLNVPGQRFAGTVENNLIEGVFEIENPRYDGSNAPPFPPDFAGDESVKKYLEPGELLESDDPVIVEKAREITAGSKDSWEAAVRLSDWVATEIGYALPGGLTARKTYDMKSGECGAHSLLLAAFCRAVGIPARVIWGCMYVPKSGGSFGQHAWNEIYMGKAGWIPVDATAMEIDYLDSGHIRFGEFESMTISFNPHETEVLDHRLGSGEEGAAEMAPSGKYDEYLGKFKNPERNRIITVLVQSGNLAIDIPNQITLTFNDPDEEGMWLCKMTNNVYLTFERNEEDEVERMVIHEVIRMPRKSDPDEMDEDVPEKFRPYLGNYMFTQLNAMFKVLYRDGTLAVYDPLEKTIVKFQPPDEKGRFLDEYNKNTLYFETGDDGAVAALFFDSAAKLYRQ